MQVVKADTVLITESDPIKKIEQVARVCYKSEDKICEGSAEKMVRALVKSKHYAMLEHSSVILDMDVYAYTSLQDTISLLEEHYGELVELRYTAMKGSYIISGNMRAWLEFFEAVAKHTEVVPLVDNVVVDVFKQDKYKAIFGELLENLLVSYAGTLTVKEITGDELTREEMMVHLDYTVKFIVDRGVSHEIVRHRKASYAQESTRYCNYGKSGEVKFIDPCYLEKGTVQYIRWRATCINCEESYLKLLEMKATPQEARAVLPTCLKTEVVMTANLKEWVHFFNLRALGTTGKPHPQMLEVAVPLLEKFKELEPLVFESLGE